MQLTKSRLEQFVKHYEVMQKCARTKEKTNINNSLLKKQMRQTKQLLKRLND